MIQHYIFNALAEKNGYQKNIKVMCFASDFQRAKEKLAKSRRKDPSDFFAHKITENIPQVGNDAWWDDPSGEMTGGVYKVVSFEDPDRIILERDGCLYKAHVFDVRKMPSVKELAQIVWNSESNEGFSGDYTSVQRSTLIALLQIILESEDEFSHE